MGETECNEEAVVLQGVPLHLPAGCRLVWFVGGRATPLRRRLAGFLQPPLQRHTLCMHACCLGLWPYGLRCYDYGVK